MFHRRMCFFHNGLHIHSFEILRLQKIILHLCAEANSQYNLAAYTNHADEAYPLPVCTKAAELYDLEATELQKAYNGEESLSDVCKSLTKQADKLLQE